MLKPIEAGCPRVLNRMNVTIRRRAHQCNARTDCFAILVYRAAPQRAIPQPNFVPVSCSVSRTYHKRGILGSPSKLRYIPFTSSFTITVPLPT
jgi:hypothetical protein